MKMKVYKMKTLHLITHNFLQKEYEIGWKASLWNEGIDTPIFSNKVYLINRNLVMYSILNKWISILEKGI